LISNLLHRYITPLCYKNSNEEESNTERYMHDMRYALGHTKSSGKTAMSAVRPQTPEESVYNEKEDK